MLKNINNTIFESIKHIDEEGSEGLSCNTHYVDGNAVRKAICEIGGTMPEDLPTPNKSIKEMNKYKEIE